MVCEEIPAESFYENFPDGLSKQPKKRNGSLLEENLIEAIFLYLLKILSTSFSLNTA